MEWPLVSFILTSSFSKHKPIGCVLSCTVDWRFKRKCFPDVKGYSSPPCSILLGMQRNDLDEKYCDQMPCFLCLGVRIKYPLSVILYTWSLNSHIIIAITMVTPYKPLSRMVSFCGLKPIGNVSLEASIFILYF